LRLDVISRRTLTFRYAVFALVATGANLASQALTFRVVPAGPLHLPAGLAVGTGVGLVVKYALDKRWIFFDRESGIAAHGRKFTLYALMGVATTVIFWGTELGFEWASDHAAARYVGGALGLAIGYLVKYRLDRRFVFRGAT
jgi:putative flippase GtrA